jgi:hypothetical protein
MPHIGGKRPGSSGAQRTTTQLLVCLALGALNQSTGESYTRCREHTDIARLRVLPVCQCCVA